MISIPLPVDEREVEVESIGESGRSLRSSRVGGDDDSVLPIGDGRFDVSDHDGFGEEVVDRNVEETLDLGGVKVHGDNVVGSGDGDEVGDEPEAKERRA